MTEQKKPELLMPAGSLPVLKTAIDFGADAVYIGGDIYSLRAKAVNFSKQDMILGIEYAHERGKKVYVTVNITAHNRDLEGMKEYLKELESIGPDGLIISDPGVFSLAHEYAPSIERHISTQANNTNYLTYRFWYEQGATRVVCARELSLEEIRELRQNIPTDMEIESFVHGAMCISYSGRCLLSNFLTGRDANLGECTHPCRWRYHLVEETRPGEYMPVEENDRGTFIFNSKDLCMVDHIDDLVSAGISSYKCEGRMKSALYVATVTRAYRNAIDDYFKDPAVYEKNKDLYFEEVKKCTNRRFYTGFYYGKPSADGMVYEDSTYVKEYMYYGTVEENKAEDCICVMTQKNKFRVGDTLEVLEPGPVDPRYVKVMSITAEDGTAMESCPHAGQKITVVFDGPVLKGCLLRGRA
ncbi:MAG: U32 family peptidase [Lachnospiraceae bacterium]|nr:U32 family peptidase [Lachnospiraceae bacterium]